MSDLVERLRSEATNLASNGWQTNCCSPGCGIASNLATEAADCIEQLEAQITKYQARLEIDHCFEIIDGQQVRVEIEPERRDSFPDGISCRDETIKLQGEAIDRLTAQLAEAGKDAERYRYLREHMNYQDFETGMVTNRTAPVIQCRKRVWSHQTYNFDSNTLDEAIDAAIAAEGE